MTDKTAREEARQADAAGFCGFCFVTGEPGIKLAHKRDCKLVTEHGKRIGVKAEAAA